MNENRNTTTAGMFFDIEKFFSFLEDDRINYNSFKKSNLGVALVTSVTETSKIYTDTTILDLLSVDKNYNYNVVLFSQEKQIPFFVGIKPASKKDFRGEVKFLPQNTIHLTQSVFQNGKLSSESLPISIINNSYKCPLTVMADIDSNLNAIALKKVLQNAFANTHFSICLAWEDYFKWRIRVKMPEWQKSVDFYINPSNIKEVFRLRDIGDGEQRRKALKHIVHSHSRKLANGEKTQVMRHIRGKEIFMQNGYEITVIPSKDDINTIKI